MLGSRSHSKSSLGPALRAALGAQSSRRVRRLKWSNQLIDYRKQSDRSIGTIPTNCAVIDDSINLIC